MVLLGHSTHFNILVEEYASACLLILSTGLIIFAHRRRTRALPVIWYCPVAVMMLSIVQHQNTLWGFQFAWYLVLFALAVTLVILDRPTLTWWFLASAMVAAVVASYSSLQGLLVWPAGLLVLYLRRRPTSYYAVWTGTAITTTAVYFYNYSAPAGANGYALRHFGPSLEFFMVEIGDLVGVNVIDTNATGIAVLLLGSAITVTKHNGRRKSHRGRAHLLRPTLRGRRDSRSGRARAGRRQFIALSDLRPLDPGGALPDCSRSI
jgi:hypothetical protein